MAACSSTSFRPGGEAVSNRVAAASRANCASRSLSRGSSRPASVWAFARPRSASASASLAAVTSGEPSALSIWRSRSSTSSVCRSSASWRRSIDSSRSTGTHGSSAPSEAQVRSETRRKLNNCEYMRGVSGLVHAASAGRFTRAAAKDAWGRTSRCKRVTACRSVRASVSPSSPVRCRACSGRSSPGAVGWS